MLTSKRLHGRDGIGLGCVFHDKLFSTRSNILRNHYRKENEKFCLDKMILESMGADLGEDDGLEWALVLSRSGDLVGGREDA